MLCEGKWRRARRAAAIAAAGLWLPLAAPLQAAETRTIAVVDFDYSDTSGEPRNQKAEHEKRLADFNRSLRADLERSGVYRVVTLDCGAEPCSVKRLLPEELFDATRKAGARLVLFGGIHKMSTLVQWARMQIVDVEKNVVLDDRHLSFRGDSDESWKRAETFIVKQMSELRAE